MNSTTQLACMHCGYSYSKAVSSNSTRSRMETRRKRICLKCEKGFVTYEISAKDYAMLQSLRRWQEKEPLELGPTAQVKGGNVSAATHHGERATDL